MLLELGEEVIVLARPGADLQHLPAGRVRVVRGDLTDQASVNEAAKGATRIFHCAACSTDWAPETTYQAANILGTGRLVAGALRSSALERFVHVSTTDVYGYPLIPCGEDAPIVDAGLPYNRSKGLGEMIVWEAMRERGLPATIMRPATIYGPRGKDFTQEIAVMLRQRMMATVDGGSAAGGFVYVDTVAQAMLDASLHPKANCEVYNLCDGSGTTWAKYLSVFAEQLGTSRPWIDLPFGVAMRLADGLETIHRTLRLGGRPLLTRHAVLLLGQSQEFPIDKARAHFAYEPRVSLEEGIRRSVAWLNDAGATKR